jgi:hypothetical protein
LVAGVPFAPAWAGVIETSHVPAFFRRILHVAIRFFVFLFVVILQVPLAVTPARVRKNLPDSRVARIVYEVFAAAVNVATSGVVVVTFDHFKPDGAPGPVFAGAVVAGAVVAGVSGVMALERSDALPVPAAFVAVTVKVYANPLVRFFTAHESSPLVEHVCPPGLAVTV